MRLLDLLNPEHVRPGWDTYFIRLAELAATRSSCVETRSGCVIVSDRKLIATGYNGTPSHIANCSEGGCEACTLGNSQECLCIHAEVNALLEAGRHKCKGSTLYCTHFPCLECAKSIVQSGVVRVVYSRIETLNEAIEQLFLGVGLQVVHHPPAIISQVQISESLIPITSNQK